MNQSGVFLLLCVLFQPGVSVALEEVLFGPEFTMMDIRHGRIEPLKQVARRMHDHLIGAQPEGAKFTFVEDVKDSDQGTFISPNGWTFHHHLEGPTIEIRMKPGTVQFYQTYATDMQDAIFVSGANEEVVPAMFQGGGHINVSSQSFMNNPLLYRNFIVDLFNHSELFMGVFGYDTNNALPLQMTGERTIERVRQVIQAFDDGAFANDPNTIDFTKAINKILVESYDGFWAPWHLGNSSNRGKYHGVNFTHFDSTSTSRLEVRGVRPQASMDVWIRQIRLFQHRLEYLETIREPIPLKFSVDIEMISIDKHLLDPPVKAQDALREFYKYVSQSGESWADHRDYLWPKWVMDGELAKFEQGDWFLSQKGLGNGVGLVTCEGELAVAI